MSIDERKSFLNYTFHPAEDPLLRSLEEAVLAAPDASPSQLADDLLPWLFADGFIPESCREDFLWTLDTMQDWMFLRDMTCETERRSRHIRERARRIRCVVNNFVHDPLNETPLETILTDPDMRYERREDLAAGRAPLAVNYRLAAAIDRGDQRIIALTADSISSLSGQPAILLAQDWRLEVVIRAALRCRNPVLHQAVARRAAQMTPQEAKRFVQCDLGRREAMIAVFSAMADSGVMDRGDVFGHGYTAEVIEQITKLYCVRFSSHIPANMHHLMNRHGNGATLKRIAHIRDYISSDTVRAALRCLTEPDFRTSCLHSEDGIQVHLALWALGTEDDQAALAAVDRLIESGTPAQRLAACLFLQQGCLTWADSRYTPGQDMGRWLNKAVRLHPEEKTLLAVCMPPALVRADNPAALSWWFSDETEARATFETYMTLARTLDRKETLEGVGYPWLKVHLTRSDAARNACRLARLIGDDALIDRACGVLKLVDSEHRYGAAIFLTGQHRTDTQRQVFFGLLADRDPGMRAIHRRKHTGKYQPVAADAPALESLLTTRYDDARAEVLRLMLLLPADTLRESVQRLLTSRKAVLHAAGQELSACMSNIESSGRLRPVSHANNGVPDPKEISP